MKKVFAFVFVFLILFFTSCAKEELAESVQYVKINDLEPGEIPKILFLKSTKENTEMRDVELKKQLKEELKNKHIIVVKTAYKKYSLFGGEIIYTPKKEGEPDLRVEFVSSKERFIKKREEEIKKEFEKILSEIESTKGIQSIYNSGYMVGGEIYY